MTSHASYIPYRETGSFSKLVSDYIDGAPILQPFFEFSPDLEGIKNAIAQRANFPVDRSTLVAQLTRQYEGITTSGKVKENIRSLANGNAYTICTAHQPNLFTGHLYFIYKILHAIRLADTLSSKMPDFTFVPVFYMGSEDADLEELGQVNMHGKKIVWDTAQTGAVGRMLVDKKLVSLIDEMEGQLSVEAFGTEIISLVRRFYVPGQTIEKATLLFVNELFQAFGLVVLLPDNSALKRLFIPIVKKELLEQFSSKAVSETIANFPGEYKVQAAGRELNLFYLQDDVRERIERSGDKFTVTNTDTIFTESEMLAELESYPERFSPNVITRPLYQEHILPNIAFIGGGAELAYWLELKNVFIQAGLQLPVLVLRNSFLIVDQKVNDRIKALQLAPADFFEAETKLIERVVAMKSSRTLTLEKEKELITSLYDQIASVSIETDRTLEKHVQALSTQALKKLLQLEKKILSAEKRRFEAEQRQIAKIKSALFSGGTLQERVDNLLPYYAKYGAGFLDFVYEHSTALDMRFCIITTE